MKKLLILSLILLFGVTLDVYTIPEEEEVLKGFKVSQFPFFIYHDAYNRYNHYIPSGWMGDYGDIKYNERWRKDSKVGDSCIQIKYTGQRSQGAGWAGIYWQNPANNWGTSKGGYDLTGAKKLYFYARGEKGGEIVEFKIGGITGQYSDTSSSTTGVIELAKKWELYEIELNDMDLTFIIGGFCVVFAGGANPDGCTFYIDEVYFTKETAPLKEFPKDKKSGQS